MRTFIDANVFVHAWTLDVLLSAADTGMVEPRWSRDVILEAERAFSEVRPGSAGQARAMMEAAGRAYPDAMVEGYETRIAALEMPDDGDRHVLAAAAESGCDSIVTYNLRDFPQETLALYGLEALHPDDLLMRMVEMDPDAMRTIMKTLVRTKAHPPRTIAEEVAGLRRNRLERFSDWLAS
ncbi:MAG: PIN domain-containing protein [Coriobacteriales bacterium]|nr:PIN domain-containing protein [Coriobacteriales bacterium]